MRIRDTWGYATANYSYQRAIGNEVPLYTARTTDGSKIDALLLGFPAHKATLAASVRVIGNLRFNPTVIYVSERYNTYWDPNLGAEGDNAHRRVGAMALVNVFLIYRDVYFRGLDLSVGVCDAFNSGYVYLPAYDNYNQGTPAPSRELVMKVGYSRGL